MFCSFFWMWTCFNGILPDLLHTYTHAHNYSWSTVKTMRFVWRTGLLNSELFSSGDVLNTNQWPRSAIYWLICAITRSRSLACRAREMKSCVLSVMHQRLLAYTFIVWTRSSTRLTLMLADKVLPDRSEKLRSLKVARAVCALNASPYECLKSSYLFCPDGFSV